MEGVRNEDRGTRNEDLRGKGGKGKGRSHCERYSFTASVKRLAVHRCPLENNRGGTKADVRGKDENRGKGWRRRATKPDSNALRSQETQVFEIGSVEPSVSSYEPLGMNLGMGPNEEITQYMLTIRNAFFAC